LPWAFSGQRSDASTGLYFYNARYYAPLSGRFVSADTIVPEPGNPQALNRYAHVLNNPIRYVDADGHLPIIPIIIIGAVVALKVVDYGWTAWDSYQSLKVIQDPHASDADKAAATANLALTAAFEAAEPDDLLPVALPLDDLARRGLLKQLPLPGMEDLAAKAWAVRLQKLPIQTHHILSNKHTTKWTAEFERIIKPYGLDLDGAWNKVDIPHPQTGGHPDRYHEWLFRQLQVIDTIAKGDQKKFLELYNQLVRQRVLDHPEMLFEDWWDMMSP
jgi:RHS repeat-associated protein